MISCMSLDGIGGRKLSPNALINGDICGHGGGFVDFCCQFLARDGGIVEGLLLHFGSFLCRTIVLE